MIRIIIAAATIALSACASSSAQEPAAATPAAFNASECYDRAFEIYFDQYAADLSPEARSAISTVDTSLRGCRITRVRIIGLAGALGDTASNQELSERRAQIIADYLARSTSWPRSTYQLSAVGETGATLADGSPELMRRRAHIAVTAVAP
jgi:outer membrane protein OmpA-like peptidoglycan-associated protein